MENVKESGIPMSTSCKLDQDLKEKALDPKLYRGMIVLEYVGDSYMYFEILTKKL